MPVKTTAIMLHTIKYGDNSVIAHAYTLHYGRVSLIVQGMRKKNSPVKVTYLQPLQINEIDFYFREKNELHRLKELKSLGVSENLLFDIKKSAVALFIAEVLYKTLKEQAVNNHLFSFLVEQITHLNGGQCQLSSFHIRFLLDLSLYLGFYPNLDGIRGAPYFNMLDGVFTTTRPHHEFYISGELNGLLKEMLQNGEGAAPEIPSFYRNSLLNMALDYYMLHIEPFGNLKSLPVLKDLFNN